jgi:diaminohydroxyphosphoribosylaminopyrimidine deaminase/5-amino-6-(5-phosphoribosylamino)uracil reductase
MTGIGTVLADDPMLTCRAQGISCIKNPIRIICDTRFQTPLESQIVKTANEIPTIIVVGRRENDQIYQQHKKKYENAGCVILEAPQKLGHIDLKELMILLGQKGIDSIFMEGGAMLNWSALESGIVNEIQAYLAPKLFGGADAKMPVGGVGVTEPDKAFKLGRPKITSLGEDILVECEVIGRCLQEL